MPPAGSKKKSLNLFAPSHPHSGQQTVLDELDSGTRWVMVRAGRKWRKTSMMVSWLMETAIKTGLVCPFIAPNRLQGKNIVWDDHVSRILNHFKEIGFPYKKNETELSIDLPCIDNGIPVFRGGKFQVHGVENQEALRGISNWGAVGCFPAGTLVLTNSGWKKIELINKNDKIITPNGGKKVTRFGKSGESKKITFIRLSTGERLWGTPNHKVFTNNGLTRLDELRYNDVVWTTKYHKQSSLMEPFIGYRSKMGKVHITDPEEITKQTSYTMPSIDSFTGKSLKDRLSTMLTETDLTMLKKTSSVSRLEIIPNYTQMLGGMKKENLCLKDAEKTSKKHWSSLDQKKAKKSLEKTLSWLLQKLLNGTDLKKEQTGILKEAKKTGETGNTWKKLVKNVEKNIWQLIQNDPGTAPHVVEIKSLSFKEEYPVYNLTVEKDHCYFADGILVSNCDEYDDWVEDIFPLIIRPNLIPHQAPCLVGGTPKGYANMWKLEKGGIFKCHHFTSYDNPEIDKTELEAMVNEYKKMGEGYFRQEILAEYERPYGTVYEEWSETNYKEFDYDPFLPLHLSFDFGVNDPTAIVWLQPNGGEFRVIDYYETADASIEHFVQVIRAKPYKKPDLITGDAAGKARSITTNTSPIEEYGKHGLYIKTKDGLQIPDQIRITHKYINSTFLNKKTCERLRDCMINYRYPEKRSGLVNQSNEIPIHNWASHGLRALEYYFANVDGGSLFRDYTGVKAVNMGMRKKWSI